MQFPQIRTALQQSAQLFVDQACLQLATDIQIQGFPVPRAIINPVQGLWPVFTSSHSVLYYRTPAGSVASMSPVALDLTTVRTVEADDSDPASLIALFAALAEIGLPIVYTGSPVPTIASLTPATALGSVDTQVVVAGTGFEDAVSVTFDGSPVVFQIVDDLTINAQSGLHDPGAVDVVVTNGAGASDPSTYTFGPPTITPPLDPATGSTDGGDAVVITGVGFTGATSVTFATIAGTDFSVVDDATIHVTTPAVTAGAAAVVVVSPSGDSAPGTFLFA